MSPIEASSLAADFDQIPIVDLADWYGDGADRIQFADRIRAICHEIGFFVLVNHRVDSQFVDSVFDVSRALFELAPAEKRLIDKRASRHFRGWEGVGAEYTNNRPDIREQVDLWTEHAPLAADIEPHYLRLLGPNQWFPAGVLPQFRPTLNQWFERMAVLAGELMEILAVGLGLPPECFEEIFGEKRMSLTKLIRYPETPAGQFGVNGHHDAGFLTILAAGETPGLQVQRPSGSWIPVPIVPNAFVINLGEMLQGMSGNYFVATPHRVVTTAPRHSVAYFHGPSLDTPLTPLDLAPAIREAVAKSPRHAHAGFMARRDETEAGVGDMQSQYRPAVYGEQLWNYFCRSYPENVVLHYPQ